MAGSGPFVKKKKMDNPERDPAYTSSILEEVFSCEVYNDLQVSHLRKHTEFQKLLTKLELEKLQLESWTNTDKLYELKQIARSRWSFEHFETFLDVLREDNCHIEKELRLRLDKARFLKPVLTQPSCPDIRLPPEQDNMAISSYIVESRPCDRSYSHINIEAQTVPKIPVSLSPQIDIKPKERYQIDTSPRGLAVVINNENFNHLERRKGSSEDKRHLSKLFDYLGYKVAFKNDLSASEMREVLCNFAKDNRLRQVSAIIIVILTHGMVNDVLFGKDGKIERKGMKKIGPVEGTYLRRCDIQKIFSSSSCPHMCHKPKGFIFQACRGDDEDKPKSDERNTSRRMNSDGDTTNLQTDGPSSDESSGGRKAEMTDFIFAFPSAGGYKAYRQPQTGSPFIKQLCEMIIEHASRYHFEDILKLLRQKFQLPLQNEAFMTPESTTTLLKDWYFNPPQ